MNKFSGSVLTTLCCYSSLVAALQPTPLDKRLVTATRTAAAVAEALTT